MWAKKDLTGYAILLDKLRMGLALEIRKITKDERLALNDLYRYAYTEWSDQDVKDEELDDMRIEETLGVFENGRLVSSLRVHDFQQSVRGVLKSCGGIAGVATYPEARRKGFVRKLMQESFTIMHKQGQSVSMLDPFKQTYYEQFGFVAANAPYLIEAPIKQLTVWHPKKQDSDWTYERVRAVNAKEDYLNFVREVGPSQYHGYIIFKTIPDTMWKRRVKDSVIVFVKYKGNTEALSRYRIKGERIKGQYRSTFHVIDALWRSRAARDRLFAFYLKHQDQIDNISIHAPFETKVEHWFKDTRLKVERKTTWMVRIIDAKKAIEDLPGAGEDIISVELSDSDCPWNNGVFSLQSEKGRLRLTESSGHSVVKSSIQAFSSLLYGTQSLEELEFQGNITVSEKWARHILQRWFPPLSLYNVVYF
ncbi:MAG: enhanced intracellular survival protein Eis [Promethearchaeota archaeon]